MIATPQRPPLNVLFLCTHNSARSILAEALLNAMGQGRFKAYSAGSSPRDNQQPHPLGLQALAHAGIPTEGLRSKSWDEFAAPGAPHMDREDGQIAPKVVIAMKIDMSLVLQDGYREDIKTEGDGQAVIFQNGTAQEVTWHKPTRTSQITFTDAAGKDVPLVRGQTWIAAVPNSSGSVSWQ